MTRIMLAMHQLSARKWIYAVTVLLVFAGTFSLLLAVDLVPNAISLSPTASRAEENPDVSFAVSPLVEEHTVRSTLSADVSDAPIFARTGGELPVAIEIQKLGMHVSIANPTATDIETLDHALLNGAVRYPTSAKLGNNGNVVLFGHSSYLPVVHNQAFKAFNEIQRLSVGDTIVVKSKTKAYTYKVEEVGEADAEADAIPLSVAGQKLTLSTCDSFGAKTARFIVIATLVETETL